MSLLEALDEQELSPDQGWTHSNQFTNFQQGSVFTSSANLSMTSSSSGGSSGNWNSQLGLKGLLQGNPQPMEDIKMEAADGPEEVMLVDQNQQMNMTDDEFGANQDQLHIQLGDQIYSVPNTPGTQYIIPPELASSPDQQLAFQSQSPMEFMPSQDQTITVSQTNSDSSIQYTLQHHAQQNPIQQTVQHHPADQNFQYSPAHHIQQTDTNTQYQHLQHVQHQQQYASSEGSYSNSPVPASFNTYSSNTHVSEQSPAMSPAGYTSSSQASCESPVVVNTMTSPSNTQYSQPGLQSPGMSMIREYDTGSPHFSDTALSMSSEEAQDSPVFGTPNPSYANPVRPQQNYQSHQEMYSVSNSNSNQVDVSKSYGHRMTAPTRQAGRLMGKSSLTTQQVQSIARQQLQELKKPWKQSAYTSQQQPLNTSEQTSASPHQMEEDKAEYDAVCEETFEKLSAQGQKFDPGLVYFVAKPNGNGGFLAKYTEQGLTRIRDTGPSSSPCTDPGGNIIGGGRGLRGRGRGRGQGQGRGRGQDQGQPHRQILKGNPTGMHMTAPEMKGRSLLSGNQVMMNQHSGQMCTPNKVQNILPNGRIWHHTSTLSRPPLHSDMRTSPNAETSVSSSTSSHFHNVGTGAPKTVSEADSTSVEKFTAPADPPKPKKPSGADGYAYCKFCGYTSGDIEKCERCYRKFPPDVKVVKKYMESGKTIDRKSFYGSRLSEQSKPYKKPQSLPVANARKCTSPVSFNPQGVGNTYVNRRGSGRGSRSTPRSQRMSYGSHEPETVTISSSDEEDGSHGFKHGHHARHSAPSIWQSSADVGAGPSYQPGLQRSPLTRRDRMEDASGKLPGKRGKGRKPKMRQMELLMAQPATASKSKCDISVELNVRSVRIGCMKSTPLEHVTINREGFQFHVSCDDTEQECQFSVVAEEIEECKVFLKQTQPLMFLHTTDECAERLRAELDMEESDRPVFSPLSDDLTQKYIVIIINKIEECERQDIRLLFQHYEILTGFTDTLTDLSGEDANLLLVKTTPKNNNKIVRLCDKAVSSLKEKSLSTVVRESTKGQEDMEDSEASRSPSPPPKIGFSGPIEKLLTYPPPPTKGGITITNEDLYCLNEGEFLNDVIIDFYLKYLFMEKFSDEDKKRTHIFSSFFYKRLTQKQARNSLPEDIAKLPAMIKRHTRVKTWTRHVDLFEKDFIIVPINEHSHWFLAIICFPNMDEEERVPYIPRSPDPNTPETNTEETSDDLNKVCDAAQEESEETEEGEQQKEEKSKEGDDSSNTDTAATTDSAIPNKEIRGTPLDPKEAMADESKEYSLGVRQACVLIFDSLAGPSRHAIVRILKEYLQVEWDTKKKEKRQVKDKLKGAFVKVPQQTNYSDCGVYLLQYVESFFQDPIMDFTLPMKSLKNWFEDELVLRKRDEIRDLILDLKKKEESASAS